MRQLEVPLLAGVTHHHAGSARYDQTRGIDDIMTYSLTTGRCTWNFPLSFLSPLLIKLLLFSLQQHSIRACKELHFIIIYFPWLACLRFFCKNAFPLTDGIKSIIVYAKQAYESANLFLMSCISLDIASRCCDINRSDSFSLSLCSSPSLSLEREREREREGGREGGRERGRERVVNMAALWVSGLTRTFSHLPEHCPCSQYSSSASSGSER